MSSAYLKPTATANGRFRAEDCEEEDGPSREPDDCSCKLLLLLCCEFEDDAIPMTLELLLVDVEASIGATLAEEYCGKQPLPVQPPPGNKPSEPQQATWIK